MKQFILVILGMLTSFTLFAQSYHHFLTKSYSASSKEIQLDLLFEAAIRSENLIALDTVLYPILNLLQETNPQIKINNSHPRIMRTRSYSTTIWMPINNNLNTFFTQKNYKKLLKNKENSAKTCEQFLAIVGLRAALYYKPNRALNITKKLLKTNPNNAKAFLIRGQIPFLSYQKESTYSKTKNLSRALALDSSLYVVNSIIANFYHNQSVAQLQSNQSYGDFIYPPPYKIEDFQDASYIRECANIALNYYNKAISQDSLNLTYFLRKGELLEALGQKEKAIKFYYKSMSPQYSISKNDLPINRILSIYRDQGDYDKAIELYEQELSKTKVPDYHYGLGIAYFYYLKKDYQTALEKLDLMDKSQLDQLMLADIDCIKGMIYNALGEHHKSIAILRPHQDNYSLLLISMYFHGEYFYNLAFAYYKTKAMPLKQVIELIDDALNFDYENKKYLNFRAEVLRQINSE